VRSLGPKKPRVRLDPEAYRQLRLQILSRDGWRCQVCGGMSNLEVHHLNPKSRLGSDVAKNLVTLCKRCHACQHKRTMA
jgi:5-methylcytosine-specific restriction endonuclease McrA